MVMPAQSFSGCDMKLLAANSWLFVVALMEFIAHQRFKVLSYPSAMEHIHKSGYQAGR